MVWARLLAYVTGTINQELLLKNEYLVAENRILKTKVRGRLVLSRVSLAKMLSGRERRDIPLAVR
jgi:hypothetical protein